MTTLSLSDLITQAGMPVDLTTSRAKLLFLADFLDKLPVSALRMEMWMTDVSEDDVYDRFSRERALELTGANSLDALDEINGHIAFTPDPVVHATCGFAACAVGWAGSCREFVNLGLHMVIGESCGEIVAYPVFKHHHGLEAVEQFFDISSYAVQYLFTSGSYDEEVTPQEVATQIRNFVTSEIDK